MQSFRNIYKQGNLFVCMFKKRVLFFLLLFSFAWLVSSQEGLANDQKISSRCTDSDGGLNYFVKGSIVGSIGTGSYEDSCINSSSLVERHCLGEDPNNFTVVYTCANGCSNGACISFGNPPSQSRCTDSDGGKNVLVAGVAGILGVGRQGDWCDYSQGKGKIYEAYCINESSYSTELMDCPSDNPFCNKGECSSNEAKCTENDGGKNPLVLGTTFPSRIANPTGSTDYCRITSTGQPTGKCEGSDCSLREFFCVENYPDELYNDIPCISG